MAKDDFERQMAFRKEGKGNQIHIDNALSYLQESEQRYRQHMRTEHRK